jgi:hypothetical protein
MYIELAQVGQAALLLLVPIVAILAFRRRSHI